MPIKVISADRAGWLALRKQYVTASVAGALLGVHEYTTAFQLWAEKTDQIDSTLDETPVHVSDDGRTLHVSDLERGNLLEPVAVEIVRRAHPAWSIARNAGEFYADDDARLGATPDAFVVDENGRKGVLQIKTVSEHAYRQKWRDPETREINLPLWIAIQASIEAHLTGAEFAYVAAMVVDHKLTVHLIEIPLNPRLVPKVKEAVRGFWSLIERGDHPPPDYYRDASVIARVYDEDDGSEVDLSDDLQFAETVTERAMRSKRKSEDEKQLKALNAAILHRMGNAARARFAGGSVTASTTRRGEYVVKPTSFRSIRVKMEGMSND